jgi:hypothetical protein
MKDFTASLSGRPIECLQQISSWSEFRNDFEIDRCEVDNIPIEASLWSLALNRAKTDAFVFWNGWTKQIGYRPKSEVVTFCLPNGTSSFDDLILRSEPLAFELAVFETSFADEWIAAAYPRWGFGRSMVDHGWGCAYRGTGHDRLVSRRWLDFGPWRVIRRPDDTTFIQFHDLDITDPAEAYAQAAPGHERMGIAATGGYIAWHYEKLLTGAAKVSALYLATTRTLEIVVGPGNSVTQGEMICQCARRLQHRLEPPASNRIDHVAYIFTDRADAEAHLHELWLRELQCWYIDGHGKHRLDADYHPVPNPPAWVKKLDGT